jgi:hypothetical protein
MNSRSILLIIENSVQYSDASMPVKVKTLDAALEEGM